MHSVFQPRKYFRDLPRRLEKQITKNDGLPQQICARCFGKVEFTYEFFKRCQNVQQTLSTFVTDQTKEIAMCQKKNNIVIEDKKIVEEVEANKENVTPTIKTSGSSRSSRNCLKQRNKSLLPSKKQVQDLMIVKQDEDSEVTCSQEPSLIVAVKTDQLRCISTEKSQSDYPTLEEIETSCISSGEKVKSNKSDETDSTLSQMTNINESICIKTEEDMDDTVVSSVPNDELRNCDFVCKQRKVRKKNLNKVNRLRNEKSSASNKISQLISEEQRQAIEMSYRVNKAAIDDTVLGKQLIVLDKKNIKCNICAVCYSRKDKCRVHVMGHLEMKPYECKKCNFKTVTVSNIRTHIRKFHLKIKPYACDQCEKHFVTMFLLKEHINTHTGARPFKCENCNVAYATRQALNYHNMTHKPNKDIKCESCNKMFYSKTRRRAHMVIHKKNMLKCHICKTRLSNKKSLETHMKNIHSQKYICDICNKELTCRRALANHKNVVHKDPKYRCNLCPNVYKGKHVLEDHLLKHKGIRKYRCTICSKSFTQQSHLVTHSVMHSKIRYSCPGCEKLFKRRDNMKAHARRCPYFLKNPDLAKMFVPRIHAKSNNLPFKNNDERPIIKHENSTSEYDVEGISEREEQLEISK